MLEVNETMFGSEYHLWRGLSLRLPESVFHRQLMRLFQLEGGGGAEERDLNTKLILI